MTDIKPKIIAPFTLVSASIHNSGYLTAILNENGKVIGTQGFEFVNTHEDRYSEIEGTPLQSPFTERWVGGHSHRHIDINNDGLDNARNRPEAWHTTIKTSGVRLHSHRIYNSPPALLTREELAKRPINVKNILTTTSSVAYGNFRLNYEVVHTGGRFSNSLLRNLLTGSENAGELRTRFVSASNAALDNTRRSLSALDAVKNKTVIVSRFNAPGGVNESTRASLDVASEEMSPNIPLTYRNNSVRQNLLVQLSGSMSQGNVNNMIHGVNRNTLRKTSGIVDRDNFYIQRPIPRTDIQYMWISSSAVTKAIELGGYQSSSMGDDKQRDIIFSGESDDRVLNINKKEFEVDFATNTLQPLVKINLDKYKTESYPTGNIDGQGFSLGGRSSIRVDSDGTPWVLLLGGTPGVEGSIKLEYRFTTPVVLEITSIDRQILFGGGSTSDTGDNLNLEISTNDGITWTVHQVVRFGSSVNINATLSQRITKYEINQNGPFYVRLVVLDPSTTQGWAVRNIKAFPRQLSIDNPNYQNSSWKQIRAGESEVAKRLRDTNQISVLDAPLPRSITVGGYSVNAAKREGVSAFTEPPVSIKYKPLKHKFIFKGNSNPLLAHEVVHTFNNNLSMFANKELNDRVGAEELRDQIYDRLREFYNDSDTSEDDNPIAKFLGYTHEEVVFPQEENTGLEKIRKRKAYILDKAGFDRDGYDRQFGTQRPFWRDSYYQRFRSLSGSFNSQNEFIGALNITSTLHTNFGAAEAGYEGPYSYTSYMSSSGYNRGQNSILAIDKLQEFILLLTGSLINTGAYNAPFTSSQRVYTFENAGELNSFMFIDTFANDAGGFGGDSDAAQLIRNSDLSLFLLQTNARITNLQTQPGGLAAASSGNGIPYIWYFENSGSVFPQPRIRYCAFLGGWESGSRSNITDKDPFSAKPIGKVTSSLDFGLTYMTDVLSGKKPWFDSYEYYISDIKPRTQDYSILPEFRISEHMRYYVSQSGGNFRATNNAFLTLDGIGNEYRSSLSENGFFSNNFFKTYVNSDIIKNHDELRKQNKKLTKLERISFKVSGIKKLLPYNGFYPIQRTVQLANLYSEYIKDAFHGGYYISAKQYIGPPEVSNDGFVIDTKLADAAFKQSALEPLFSPGILFNTIKSGIAVDWPAVTASFRTNGEYTSLDYPQFTYVDLTLPLSYRPFISMRIPFEALLDPTLGFAIKQKITSSVPIIAQSTGFVAKNVRDTYLMSHFDASSHSFIQQGNDDQDYVGSVPFSYIMKNASPTSLYALSMNNFLAETVRFFLQDQKMNAFVSKEESKWKIFENSKIYYMDIVLKKDPGLVMIEAYTSSFTLDAKTSTTVTSKTNTMHGRYFGYPVDMNNQDFTIHHDPAYAPYTPPYFEGEAVLRVRFAPATTQKYTLDQIFQQATVESIFGELSNKLHTSSVAFRNKMGIDSSINVFGQTRLNEIEFDATRLLKPSIIKQSTNSTRNAWVIGPKMETPVLDFSNQPMTQKLGDYWVGAGFGRGMWSGYGEIPSGSKGVYFELRESFPMQLVQKGSRSGSLLQQCGFRPQSKKIGQIAESKEISEAIVAIPYLDNQIPGVTTSIGGLNFIRINRSILNTQKKNIENNEAAIKIGNFGSKEEIQETSISKMIEMMGTYVVPPHYNFIQYPDIVPFAMYIFEFKHVLSQQDLSDIWQGLMPKIATTAELDEVELEHPSGKFEFFHGREIPPNLRWMVFKIKKKAEKNYFKVTADSTDDDRFIFDFQIGRKEPEYSFNWPYDYFSLVEFAKVELSLDYANKNLEDKITQGQTSNFTRSILTQSKKKRGRRKK